MPGSLDDWVDQDNPVRVIDAFVDALDLKALGFETAIATDLGRPGDHPAAHLKLYVYGYLNRVQSSRRLEREAQRNLDLQPRPRRPKQRSASRDPKRSPIAGTTTALKFSPASRRA